jgi:hypothetical protein
MATSVWSASDASATGMVLSNGGLTVAQPGTASWGAIRSSISKTSGKLYIEFAVSTSLTDWQWSIGLANSTINLTIGGGLGKSNYSCGILVGGDGTNVSAGFTSHYNSSLPSYQPNAGVVFALAVDFTAGSIWIAQDNVWSNSSNPATASLPVVSFTPATVGPLFAGMSIVRSNGGVWTLQPTAASQKYAPPSGFSAWDAPAGVTQDLAGDLAPVVALSAGLAFSVGLTGDLTPSLAFAADISVVTIPVNYVDLAGNLGGSSAYGKLAYGTKSYSRSGAITPIFAGDLSGGVDDFTGDLAPVVTFAADLGLLVGLAGGITSQIGLGATLTGTADVEGDLPLQIVLAASGLISGPLWAPDTPAAPPWAPSEPCPPSMWTPTEPCDPVDWEESELCNG